MPTFTVVSCYISPNCTLDQYEEDIDALAETLPLKKGPLLVGGDFNAAARMWGSRETNNRRGQYLIDMMAGLDMVTLNTGNLDGQ